MNHFSEYYRLVYKSREEGTPPISHLYVNVYFLGYEHVITTLLFLITKTLFFYDSILTHN